MLHFSPLLITLNYDYEMMRIQQQHALSVFLHPFYPFILTFLAFSTARCQHHRGCMVSISDYQATAPDGSLVTEGF